jgi:hypothetical protein
VIADLLASTIGKFPKSASRLAQLCQPPAKEAMKALWQTGGEGIISLWDRDTSNAVAHLLGKAVAAAPSARFFADAALIFIGHRDLDVRAELVSSLVRNCVSASARQAVLELLFSGIDESLTSSTSSSTFCFGQFAAESLISHCSRGNTSSGGTASFTSVNSVRLLCDFLYWLLTTLKFFEVDGLTTQRFPPSISTWFEDPLRHMLHAARSVYPMTAENAAVFYSVVVEASGLLAILKCGEAVLLCRSDDLTSEQHARLWFPQEREFLAEVRQLYAAVLLAVYPEEGGRVDKLNQMHLSTGKLAATATSVLEALSKSKIVEPLATHELGSGGTSADNRGGGILSLHRFCADSLRF